MPIRLFISIFITFSLIQYSFAQENQILKRKGFVFGTSIGIAYTNQSFPNKSQSNTDLALDFKLGYMIKPNLAILLSSNVSSYEYSGIGRTRKRDFGILAPSVQYWFNERIWIMGGMGLGVDAPIFFDIEDPDNNEEETQYHTGLGLLSAVGYEIYQGKKFILNIKARMTYRNVTIIEGKTFGFSPALLIGINFY